MYRPGAAGVAANHPGKAQLATTIDNQKNVGDEDMELGKIFLLVALVFAAVAGVASVPHAAAIIAVLGLAAGLFVGTQNAQMFLICTLALALVHGAPAVIPVIGPTVTDVLGSISALFNAAACTVVLLTVVQRLRPD